MVDIYTLETKQWQRGAPPVPGVDPEYAEFQRELLREKKRLIRKEGFDERAAVERAYIYQFAWRMAPPALKQQFKDSEQ